MIARKVVGFLLVAAATALLAFLPALTSSRSLLTWGFLILLYTALAQSWNLLSGFGGQVNLGHAAFFGLGALVTRALWFEGFPLVSSLLGGTAAAAVAGLVIGAPSLRLHGPYFAIGTLAVAEILRITTGNLLPEVSTLTAARLAGYQLAPRYYLAFGVAMLTILAAWRLQKARFGYGLAAVREDEAVAEASGVHAFRHKLAAFILSSAMAGLTGGVFGFYHVSFYPQFAFSPLWTFDALLITFLGGVGTVWGPAVGAIFFLVMRETLAFRLVEVHLLIFGILFIIIVLALPGGLIEGARMLALRRSKEAY